MMKSIAANESDRIPSKKIVALLTGRGNNTLKDKNVLPVLGKPLLYYPAMAAKRCGLITDFYVSSDDDKILDAAAACGYKKIRRPEELALPTSQHVDAIFHALRVMADDGVKPDILVVLLANSGIVKTEWIEESVNNLLSMFMDTSLVTVVSMFDLTGSLQLALGDANWRDFFREGYIFVAAIYFVSSFVMSRYSQWLEKRIGSGAKTR